MVGSFKKFLKNRSGAFAIQFALMVIPLVGAAGLAIDGGRAFLARYELASALDAAALAVANSKGTNAELEAIAQKFVDQNFKSLPPGSVAINLNPTSEMIELSGEVSIPTFFMPVMGVNTVAVAAASEVRRGGNNVEVALSLDITESMSGSRITALRTAAKSLISTVINDSQTPFFSKAAIVPWANNVHAGTYANSLRGTLSGTINNSLVSWRNGTTRTMAGTGSTPPGANWKNGAAYATVNKITKLTSPSRIQLTFSANPTNLANGDTIYVSGVSSPSNNSYASTVNGVKFQVADKSTSSPWTLNLKTASGSGYVSAPSGSNNATNGTVQECFNAACEIQITTTAAPSVTAGMGLWISGVGGMTQLNSSTAGIWLVGATPAPSGNSFMLANSDGPAYSNYSSAGTIQRCYDATCTVAVTTGSAHGLVDDDYAEIKSITGGHSSMNNGTNAAWQVDQQSTTLFMLKTSTGITGSSGSWSAMADSSNGTTQCLKDGCIRQRFMSKAGTVQFKNASNCVTERTGAQAYTDAAPGAGAWLGRDYPGADLVSCNTGNYITPLTPTKSVLNKAIDDFTVTGSTAGQIGVAWGWYMVSPNFGPVWPAEINRPLSYTADDIKKVVVLMSDGDFNTAHCNGVTSNNHAYSSTSNSDRINCDSTNGAPYTQAATLCANMKAAKVTVYAVAFEVAEGSAAATALKGCASEPKSEHYKLASNSAGLQTAFGEIAESISKLRISK